MAEFKIAVKDGRNIADDYRSVLERAGLQKNGCKYTAVFSRRSQVNKVKRICRRHRLKFIYNTPFSERDKDYRRRFFSNNKPDFLGKYFCVYCGILLPKEKIQVDHLYPVGAVSENMRLQRKLKRRGLSSVNDVSNLVAACPLCNAAKGKQLGWWLFKGEIGKHRIVWFIRWLIRIAIIVISFYVLWQFWNDYEIWENLKILFSHFSYF